MKSSTLAPAAPSSSVRRGDGADGSTRERIAELLMTRGPQTASDIATVLGLTATGIRRHLDAMIVAGTVFEGTAPVVRRGRGRPARRFALTESGRNAFPHTYDDLAVNALRQLARIGGRDAVEEFAAQQVAQLETRCLQAMDGAGDDPVRRSEALATALSSEGYAATASIIASGGQLCQHHCPVAHVAAEFPELCEAETQVISRLVGSHVQRLATIAHGDGICTTHVPAAPLQLRPTRYRGTDAHDSTTSRSNPNHSTTPDRAMAITTAAASTHTIPTEQGLNA